ncbi:hypothetical protein EST38_g14481 [Candolleomyces aberdarensis]|uniref:Uncharacterized protein n=1 Tax=Candolleomyces aberdarensis TaxID=2316362 RepID=A0A4Q2CZU2_9AGAR|nr:hypothetical protein EST38_g14481 [Candolleomyces aberdarensis]
MPERPSYQENHRSDPNERETSAAPTFAIFIDRSYAVYNNFYNSQNQTTTEIINSNNVSSMEARNSSLNGDSGWTFRTEGLHGTSSQPHPKTSTQYYDSSASPGCAYPSQSGPNFGGFDDGNEILRTALPQLLADIKFGWIPP